MKRLGLFMDVSNLYCTLRGKYHKKKLNYDKYLDFVKSLGEIHQAIAYGAQVKDEAEEFMCYLRHAGYSTKYKEVKEYRDGTQKANWDVGITVDIIKMMGKLDMVILGSADGDFATLVEYLQSTGVSVVVLACNISHELTKVATKCIEIPESLLE